MSLDDADLLRVDPADDIPQLDPGQRQEIEEFAQTVSDAIAFKDDLKKVSLSQDHLTQLNQEQRTFLERLVSDVNAGKIGIAITHEDGSVTLYGSAKSLESGPSEQPDNSWWVSSYGVHIYIDPWWTDRLAELQGWAIGAIIGLAVGAFCSSGVACITVALVLDFVWNFVIWRIVRYYYPDSFTIHAPWWGYAHVQPWRSNAWYNGVWFRSWLWT